MRLRVIKCMHKDYPKPTINVFGMSIKIIEALQIPTSLFPCHALTLAISKCPFCLSPKMIDPFFSLLLTKNFGHDHRY